MTTRKQPIKTIAELIKFLGQTYPLDGGIDVQMFEDGDGPLTFSATLCEPKTEPGTTEGYNANDFINIIADPSSWPSFMRLFNNASTIVGDFDEWGETLQSNDAGMYDETTTIEQMRGAIYLISPGSVNDGDYLPWLSAEQQQRLMEVAIEIESAGNGTGDDNDEYARVNAKNNVETMTPYERLSRLPDDHDWRCERLGFDPFPGLYQG